MAHIVLYIISYYTISYVISYTIVYYIILECITLYKSPKGNYRHPPIGANIKGLMVSTRWYLGYLKGQLGVLVPAGPPGSAVESQARNLNADVEVVATRRSERLAAGSV